MVSATNRVIFAYIKPLQIPLMNKQLTVGIILMMTLGLASYGISQTYAWIEPDVDPVKRKAPTVVVGENVYVVWFTDKDTPNSNGEVIFRASNDGGKTFGEKINLSNTTDADSIDAEIGADANTVAVTWWERTNQTSNVPVMKISIDNGKTFGSLLKLGANGTLGSNGE